MSAQDAGEGEDKFNRTRAELFDAIGHPTRIKILEAVSREPLTFSGLKKTVGIESSGHLSFHLEKLGHLLSTTPEEDVRPHGRRQGSVAPDPTVHEATRPVVHPKRRYQLSRSPGRLLGLAALVLAVVLVGAVAASAVSGMNLYNSQETLQGSLQYTPDGFSTIRFNNSAGTTITDFNFDLDATNAGNQTAHYSLFPLDLQIWHLPGTHLDSLQLQFYMGSVCCLNVFFGTEQGGYPWNPVITQNAGSVTVSIANFGYMGTASVELGLFLEPPFVNGNLSLSMSVQMTLQGQGTVIGHTYTPVHAPPHGRTRADCALVFVARQSN